MCKDASSSETIEHYLWQIVPLLMRDASGDWVTFSFPFFHILREDLAHNPQILGKWPYSFCLCHAHLNNDYFLLFHYVARRCTFNCMLTPSDHVIISSVLLLNDIMCTYGIIHFHTLLFFHGAVLNILLPMETFYGDIFNESNAIFISIYYSACSLPRGSKDRAPQWGSSFEGQKRQSFLKDPTNSILSLSCDFRGYTRFWKLRKNFQSSST